MIRFIGTEGEVHVSRGKVASLPEGLVRHRYDDDAIQVYESKNHRQNFIDSVKSRKPNICPATVGHRSGTICQLSGIAELLGEPVKWDPFTQQVVGNIKATAMQSRPRRPGYELPTI